MSASSRPTLPLSLEARAAPPEQKSRGPNRSTKAAHKLKVLPEQPEAAQPPPAPVEEEEEEEEVEDGSPSDAEEGDDEDQGEEDVEVYNQIDHITPGTARKDALRLTKKEKAKLPRVTAYCTASSYRLSDLMKFFHARETPNHTNPKLFNEVIYTPYSYDEPPPPTRTTDAFDLLGIPELAPTDHAVVTESETETNAAAPQLQKKKKKHRFDRVGEGHPTSEVFMFEFGVVVIWGMTEVQEKRFLTSLRRFEVEKLPPDEVEMENLNHYYANYSRIYNDVITLRKGSSYMTKLSLSHALAQSVKISLFEQLITSTIEQTKDIPEVISETGKIGMPHDEIMQQIGQLFIVRMNINMVGSVLDSPEIFWSFPDLKPLYDAARKYLEIPQRVDLLNARVEVLQDMLKLLKESVSSRHAERLEQIVIVLIGIEILLGVITILVDLFASP